MARYSIQFELGRDQAHLRLPEISAPIALASVETIVPQSEQLTRGPAPGPPRTRSRKSVAEEERQSEDGVVRSADVLIIGQGLVGAERIDGLCTPAGGIDRILLPPAAPLASDVEHIGPWKRGI